ncbi:MAG: GTP cyclohydrolase FolE2 [Burkholderiaceae bacterium]
MNIHDSQLLMSGQMIDVQGSADLRQIAIERVGVKGVRAPLRWRLGDGSEQPSVGRFAMDVALPADKKGTHMSRFMALIGEQSVALDMTRLIALHREMVTLLDARRGRIEIAFPLFLRKTAPVSGIESLMDYQVTVVVDGTIDQAVADLTVLVPVTSLCPCSKTISDYGAHNQRSHVTVTVRSSEPLSLEALIATIEAQASCELWGLLKRVDEKYVTERAYDNPKFVEDLVRDVAARLDEDERILRYVVEVENFESIHNHSAWARIESDA